MKPAYRRTVVEFDNYIDEVNKAAESKSKEAYYFNLGKLSILAAILEEWGYETHTNMDPGKGTGPLPKIISRKIGEEIIIIHTKIDLLSNALEYISEFYEMEYGKYATDEFKDIKNIPLAYTETEDGEMIQVIADLKHFSINTEIDGYKVRTEKYKDLDTMIYNALINLNFDNLVRVSEEEIQSAKRMKEISSCF